MNEQEQAELLAAWLEDPKGPPPEGLDVEVVETLVALRPETAPAARVSIDDILGSVTEGPLASPMPVGASLGAAPEDSPAAGSSGRRVPWWVAAAGVGGFGSLVMAAAALLVIGGTVIDTQSPSSVAMEAAPGPAADGVAFADTGIAKKADRQQVAGGRPRTASKPRPAARPSPKPARPKMPAFEPEADAVALSEDFDDAFDGAEGELRDMGDLDAARLRQPSIAEIPRGAADGAGVAAGPGDSAKTEELQYEPTAKPSQPTRATPTPSTPLSRPAPAPPPPAMEPSPTRAPSAPIAADPTPIASGSSNAMDAEEDAAFGADYAPSAPDYAESAKAERKSEKRRKKLQLSKGKESAPAARMEDMIPEAPAEPLEEAEEERSDDAPAASPPPPANSALAAQARQGVETATSPQITAAKASLQAGDPRAALAHAELGLAGHPTNTPVRQYLLALQGDALLQLGEVSRAREAWQQAAQLAVAR